MAYVDQDHVRAFVEAGRAEVVAPQVSRIFGDFLESCPWEVGGSRIDWQGIPHQVVALSEVSEDEILGIVRSSRVGKHDRLFFLYAPDEPGLLCDLAFGAGSFDELYWRAPGVRYMCGASVGAGGLVLACEDLMEFDGADRLTVAM